jgi:hypothetical protein
MMQQVPGCQGITAAFLFGLQGTSIIFACRVKKTGLNFQKSLFLSYFSDELIQHILFAARVALKAA